MFYKPTYPDKTDYQTNAPTYGDDLARKTELIKYLSHRIWEYDKELAARFLAWDKNLEEFDEEVLRLLKEWMDDGTFEHIINEVLMSQKLDAVVFNSYITVVKITNPKDITADVQQAVAKVPASGGTVYIPAGDYIMHGYVELPSNIHIKGGRGTIIRKTVDSPSAYTFIAGKTSGSPGYGGGARNIKIESIVFFGAMVDAFIYRGNGFAFNHVEGLHIVDCDFKDCVFGGHAIDLAGCNDVLIEKCRFMGQAIIAGREYAEAIQIDSSTPTAIGADWAGLDGLPTKDVLVRDCEFLPRYSSSGVLTSYAPNPIGNHGYTGGAHYENIKFHDNLVVDGMPTTTPGAWRGWIHFYGVKNVEIMRNTFKTTRSIPASVIQLINSSGGRYDPSTLAAGSGVPSIIMDVKIKDNHFEGFNSAEEMTLIRSYGTTYDGTSYWGSGFDISDNMFRNCGLMNMPEGQAATLIQIYRSENIKITGNLANLGKTLASVWDANFVTVSENVAVKMGNSTVFLSNVQDAIVSDNRSRGGRYPLEIQEVTNLTCSGNVGTDIVQTGQTNFANKFRNLKNANIRGNTMTTTEPNLSYGYYVYQADEGTSRNVNNTPPPSNKLTNIHPCKTFTPVR